MIHILHVGAYVSGFDFGYGSSPLTKELDRVRLSVCPSVCVSRTFHHSRKLEFLGANESRPIENHQRRTANSIDGAALTARCDGAHIRMRNPDKWVIGPHVADLYRGETCPKRGRGGDAPTEPKRNRLACEPILQGAMSGPCTAA